MEVTSPSTSAHILMSVDLRSKIITGKLLEPLFFDPDHSAKRGGCGLMYEIKSDLQKSSES